MMDPQTRRAALVQELRREGIRDERVLAAMSRVPRELFVSEAMRAKAYDNDALPIACGQTISQPYIVAFMSEALELREAMTVLEVGTGSGYQTAILAQLCARVFSIERHAPLLQEAQARLSQLGISNVTLRVGDGRDGWLEAAPFDRIIVTAAASDVPRTYIEQTKPEGIIVIPVGPLFFDQTLLRIRKHYQVVDTEELLPVRFVPLVEGSA